jgi:predicted GNAT family acetyltransferase
VTILDEQTGRRLVYREASEEAELGYRVNGKRLILVHTEVPKAIGGRGIGGRLVRAAVERARANGETLVPWCPFARKWLEDHPDDVAGVSIDWTEPQA